MNTREKLNKQIVNFALGRKAIDESIGSYNPDPFGPERHEVDKTNWEATQYEKEWDE